MMRIKLNYVEGCQNLTIQRLKHTEKNSLKRKNNALLHLQMAVVSDS